MSAKAQPKLDPSLLRVVESQVTLESSANSMAPEEPSTTTDTRYKIWKDEGLVDSVCARVLPSEEVDANDHNLDQTLREMEEFEDRLECGNAPPREKVGAKQWHGDVIGNSESFRRAVRKIEQVATTDATVLLLGETGTGKELISSKIHELSRRRQKKMVKVNCAALPATLIESELFGRERGAFTGALTREVGRFELAHDSTILLDEIGELPLELQSKLLRVLQEGEFERLGSSRTISVDARIIAATNRDLTDLVRKGKFREDLFYRLNVFPITVPPLRERREDIPSLVWHFVDELGRQMGRSIEKIPTSTMAALKDYSWPGNIRELRNLVERSLITSTDTVLRVDLPAVSSSSLMGMRTETLEEAERSHILSVMSMTGWRVRGERGAAQILNVPPTTLESRMQKLGVVRPN
jgi:formate hydrogenlyase transcriptional activator